MDRLTSMSVFVKAVDLGSFSAAASALDLSGPMVGKHIRFLEEHLQIRLLNRTTRRQSLTEFGRAYYDRCRVILAEVEATETLAADQFSEPRGKLRIAVPVLFGRHCVTPILLELAKQYPLLEVELAFSDRITDLAEDGYDFAIRTGVLADSTEVVARRVARQHMVVCAAPSYLHSFGQPQKIEDLADHEGIIYSRSSRTPPWRFPRTNQTPIEITPRTRLRFDDLAAIADAATAGMGLAWLPNWLIRNQLEAGTLVQLFADQPELLYDVYAVWLRTPQLPLKVRLAVDALVAELPKYMK